MPPSSSFIAFARPPRFAMKRTPTETANAPRKAAIPTAFSPSAAPIPRRTAEVAPREAPADMPRMYGSASGFFTIACMMTPQVASPAPMMAASRRRGRRSSHTMSCTGPLPAVSMGVLPVSWSRIAAAITSGGRSTVPIESAQKSAATRSPASRRQRSVTPAREKNACIVGSPCYTLLCPSRTFSSTSDRVLICLNTCGLLKRASLKRKQSTGGRTHTLLTCSTRVRFWTQHLLFHYISRGTVRGQRS